MKPPRQRRAKVGKQGESGTLRRKDKFLIAGVLLCLLSSWMAVEYFFRTRNAARALEIQLGQWKQRYHLTEEQVNRLRRIEREYHGTGNLFRDASHTSAEERVHARELREVMKLTLQPPPAHQAN